MSAQQPVDLTIIVVSYNTRAMTLACLDSIVAQTQRTSYELIVVDNASTDGSAAAIRQHPLGGNLIELPDNAGFARANNIAACDARGALILLLNPDTLVLNGAIDTLVAFAAAQPDARIWGGRTVFGDGRLNPSSCWARMSVWNLACRAAGLTGLLPGSRLFNGEAYGGWLRNRARRVDIVSGCFLLLPRALWLELRGFDPAFFVYGEEADLCLRAARLGARPMITPDAEIVHYGGASEATRIGKMEKLLAAKALLIRRHWQPAWQPVGLALLATWPLTRWIALAVYGRISGRPAVKAAAETWRDIWHLRRDWLSAYGQLTPASAAAGSASTAH